MTAPANIVEQQEQTETRSMDALISRIPGVQGGRPTLAGRRLMVQTIANCWKMGDMPEEIAVSYNLEPVQVYAAITYYLLYQDEIEAQIREDNQEVVEKEYKEWLERYRRGETNSPVYG